MAFTTQRHGGLKGNRPAHRKQLSSIIDSYSEIASPWDAEEYDMNRLQNQQRLYVINRAGSGEAQYVLLNRDRTDIESYGIRQETWRVIKDIQDFGVAVVNNVLFVIGGYDKITCRHLHRVVKYDPFEFTWSQCAPLLKSRAKFGICVLEGKIYVCGGTRSDGRTSCSCEVYDPVEDQWREAGVLMGPRANHCCVNYENEIYCAGGDFGTRSHDNFWVYDKDNWDEVDAECPVTLPRSIDRFAICTLGKKIYFIGGVSCKVSEPSGASKFTTERAMFSYTTSVSSMKPQRRASAFGLQPDVLSPWNTRYPSMVRPRHSCGVQPVGKKIFVFGGVHLETGQDIRVCECFDTEKGTWEDEFHFRKGDMSSITTAILEVPRRHDDQKINYHLKWVLW